MSIQSALGFFQTVPATDSKFPEALLGFEALDDLVDFGKKTGFDFDINDLKSLESVIADIKGEESANEAAITAAIIAATGAAISVANLGVGTASLVMGIMNAKEKKN